MVFCTLSSQNPRIGLRKVGNKKKISIGLIVLIMLSTTFWAQTTANSCKQYSLVLTANRHFSTITLNARLTVAEERQVRGRVFINAEGVAGALIHFCTCNSAGHILKEIGRDRTRRDGTASFSWSAPSNGNYSFIATYTLKD